MKLAHKAKLAANSTASASLTSNSTASKNLTAKLLFIKKFPQESKLANKTILIFDKRLLKNSAVKKWIKTFSNSYGVQAGEELKQIDQFKVHVNKILKIVEKMQTKDITFVSLGGGSVGDFVGFLASVFKRGMPLIHIPSTWLAAIDSAHGGKTALNCGGYKNQIGTYYSAQKVILCRDLLFTQPTIRTQDALGEVLKTGLLKGDRLWAKIYKEKTLDQNRLWSYLPALISYKYQIVKIDPFEKKGKRLYLNLGHTYGHVFEAALKLSHGHAVNLGIRTALEYSVFKKILTQSDYSKICSSPLIQNNLATKHEVQMALRKIKNISSYLLQDKKVTSTGKINFVFLKKVGQPYVKAVPVKELIAFAMQITNTSRAS